MAEGMIIIRKIQSVGGPFSDVVTGQETVSGVFQESIEKFDSVSSIIANPDIDKLNDPAILPNFTQFSGKVAFSPNDTYLAVANYLTPTIYKRDGDTFTKLADPTGAAIGTTTPAVTFSSNNTYLALAHNLSVTAGFSGLIVYKRNGDTFQSVSNPNPLIAGATKAVSFSPDVTYLAGAHANSPRITIYKRSGDTFNKLANPATLPTGTGNGTAFSNNGTYLSVAHSTSPFITIYKRSGDTFTKLANPATLPTGTGNGTAFSTDGTYLAVAHVDAPFITIYKRSGDTFNKLANPATLPTGEGRGTAFSTDGTYLTVAHRTAPFISIYKRSGDTFTKLADPATLPASTGNNTAFSNNGTYLAVGHFVSPIITIYKLDYTNGLELSERRVVASNNLFQLNYIAGASANTVELGYANESGTTGETKEVVTLFKK